MTITTIKANATIRQGSWTHLGGSPTFHDAISDTLNNTYARAISTDSNSWEAIVDVAGTGLDTTQAIRAVRTRIIAGHEVASGAGTTAKVGQIIGDSIRYDQWSILSAVMGSYTGPWHKLDPTGLIWSRQMISNALNISLRSIPNQELDVSGGVGGEDPIQIAELFIDVEHFTKPVISSVTPSGVIDVSKPLIGWNYDDIGVNSYTEFGQDAFQIEIEQNAAVLWASGTVFGSQQSYRSEIQLANGNYTVRVRGRVAWGGASELWSAWTSQTFTVDAPIPQKPDLSLTSLSNDLGRAVLTITRSTVVPLAERVRLEKLDTDGVWKPVRGADSITADVQVQVFDYELRPFETTSYRAFSMTTGSDGSDLMSPTSNTITLDFTPNRWFLRDVTGSLGFLELDVEQSSLEIEWGEDKAAFNPLGRPGDGKKVGFAVVKDSLRGDKFDVTAGMIGNDDYNQFKSFRLAQKPLLLQAPMLDGFWYMVFDSPIRNKVLNMNEQTYRQITFGVLEVDRPPDVSN